MKTLLIFSIFVFFSEFVSAQNSNDRDYFIISSYEIKEIDNKDDLPSFPSVGNELGEVLEIVDTLIAFGERAWKLLDKNKPVVQIGDIIPITVLPNIENPQDILTDFTNWKGPNVKRYAMIFKNKLGIEVVNLSYTVIAEYGGKYQGKGSYLTNVLVLPDNISVVRGYSISSEVSVIGITNHGTAEDPIAAVTIRLSNNLKTIVQHNLYNATITVVGDGVITII